MPVAGWRNPADLYDVAIDADYGALLRVSAYRDQTWRTEVLVDHVEFDGPMPADTFSVRPHQPARRATEL